MNKFLYSKNLTINWNKIENIAHVFMFFYKIFLIQAKFQILKILIDCVWLILISIIFPNLTITFKLENIFYIIKLNLKDKIFVFIYVDFTRCKSKKIRWNFKAKT